jgi:hypothetical protein
MKKYVVARRRSSVGSTPRKQRILLDEILLSNWGQRSLATGIAIFRVSYE